MSNFFRLTILYDATLITPRLHKQLMNRLYRQAMQDHKDKILPRHFENVPETRPYGAYRYLPRSRRWQKRKEREGKGDRPLVYRGLMREIVLRESIVRATASGGSLTCRNHYDMTEQRRAEVENFSERELTRMTGRMRIDYGVLVKTPQYARRRQRRITAGATP